MAKKAGYIGKLAIGSNKVVGTAKFSIPGKSWEKIDSTEMGDTVKSFLLGLGDSPTVSFSGQWDPADTTGQQAFRSANINGTPISDVRFYEDATSYFTASTTNPTGTVYVTKFDINKDLSGLMTYDAEISISGGHLIEV